MKYMNKKPHHIWIEGPITPSFIAQSIEKHQSKTNIGAHDIFLGQVRADDINGNKVAAIEYTVYKEMADEIAHQIREETFATFDLTCLHIYHSLGMVKAGEICLFVFTSSKHRQMAFDASRCLVERIKKELPVWGKEIFENDSHQWKVNQ
jgi:molybdopterin synthase catalytic subunit